MIENYASEWVYLAEGNKTIVFKAVAGSVVLRVGKKKRVSDDDTASKATDSPSSSLHDCFRKVANFLSPGRVPRRAGVEVCSQFLANLIPKIPNNRPAGRLLKCINSDSKEAVVEENVTHSCICFEIKLKGCFRSRSPFVPMHRRIKWRYSRFRLLQLKKMASKWSGRDCDWGSMTSISEYDPGDMFSNNLLLIRSALNSLRNTPQNNFRVYSHGEPVYGWGGGTVNDMNSSIFNFFGTTVNRADCRPCGGGQKSVGGSETESQGVVVSVLPPPALLPTTTTANTSSMPAGSSSSSFLFGALSQVLLEDDALRDIHRMQSLDLIDIEGADAVFQRLVSICGGQVEVAERVVELRIRSPQNIEELQYLRTICSLRQQRSSRESKDTKYDIGCQGCDDPYNGHDNDNSIVSSPTCKSSNDDDSTIVAASSSQSLSRGGHTGLHDSAVVVQEVSVSLPRLQELVENLLSLEIDQSESSSLSLPSDTLQDTTDTVPHDTTDTPHDTTDTVPHDTTETPHDTTDTSKESSIASVASKREQALMWVNTLDAADCAVLLEMWLLALTAKDCSLAISFRRIEEDNYDYYDNDDASIRQSSCLCTSRSRTISNNGDDIVSVTEKGGEEGTSDERRGYVDGDTSSSVIIDDGDMKLYRESSNTEAVPAYPVPEDNSIVTAGHVSVHQALEALGLGIGTMGIGLGYCTRDPSAQEGNGSSSSSTYKVWAESSSAVQLQQQPQQKQQQPQQQHEQQRVLSGDTSFLETQAIISSDRACKTYTTTDGDSERGNRLVGQGKGEIKDDHDGHSISRTAGQDDNDGTNNDTNDDCLSTSSCQWKVIRRQIGSAPGVIACYPPSTNAARTRGGHNTARSNSPRQPLVVLSYSVRVIDIELKPVSKIREKVEEEEEVCKMALHAEKVLRGKDDTIC